MNKTSKFLHIIVDGDDTILFNLKNESFTILNKDLAQYVDDYRQNIDDLSTVHPELFKWMKDNGAIVPEGTDEVAQLIDGWKKLDNSPANFSMIINPTLNCNLRCWYCYEEHDRMPIMSEAVYHSICRLIDNKVKEPELKGMNISFFGGEPLLGFKNVVRPLLSYASRLCKDKGVHLNSGFTTNAVLLTDEVLDFLESLDLANPATFQISLDGNRESHNKVRVGVNREPTYDIIVDSMKRAALRRHLVSARLNYTAENVLTFSDVLEDFHDLPEESKQYIHFNFQQIWQDQSNGNRVQERIEMLQELFKAEGFIVDSDTVYHRHCCYADRENNIVINSDGNLFKCTARDFIPQNREGCLLADGTLSWNDRFIRRMEIKYANLACLSCDILPLCNGGCSQGKLEKAVADSCIRNLSETDKETIIIKRLEQLIVAQKRNSSK